MSDFELLAERILGQFEVMSFLCSAERESLKSKQDMKAFMYASETTSQ